MQQIKRTFEDWQRDYWQRKNFESEQRSYVYFGQEKTVLVMKNTDAIKEWTANSAELLEKLSKELEEQAGEETSKEVNRLKRSINMHKVTMGQFDQIIELYHDFAKRLDYLQDQYKDVHRMKPAFWKQVLKVEMVLFQSIKTSH